MKKIWGHFITSHGLNWELYRYYWVHVTPRHASPLKTKSWSKLVKVSRTWSPGQIGHKSGSEKATRTRPGRVNPGLQTRVWCNPDPNRGLHSLSISLYPGLLYADFVLIKIAPDYFHYYTSDYIETDLKKNTHTLFGLLPSQPHKIHS